MKILSVFIAVLILASGFDLCGDSGIPGGKAKTEVIKENGKKQDTENGCSSLCRCLRCSFSLLPESSGISGLPLPSGIRFFNSPDNAPAGTHRAVWQPPQ